MDIKTGLCLYTDCHKPKRVKNLCNTHYLRLFPRVRGKYVGRYELVLMLNHLTEIPIKKCRVIVNTIFKTIQSGLERGEQVKIPGFGIFDTHDRPYEGWGLSPYFRPSKELKYMVRHPDYTGANK